MKKTVSLILALVLTFGALALTGCSTSSDVLPGEGEYTRVAMDTGSSLGVMELTSSVEFMIDDNAQVVTATALNDDGDLIISGEDFEGMTPGEAVEHVIYTAIDLGYIVKGAIEGDQNSVDILVTGASHYSKALGTLLVDKAKAALKKLDVPGKVELAKENTVAELTEMVNDCGLFTEEEVADMNTAQLLIALAESRKYASPLMTDELRAVYMSTKNHKINLAKSTATAKVIGGLGDLYSSTHTAYAAAVGKYGDAITAIDDFSYDTLIAPDSTYQKTLAEIQSYKAKLLAMGTLVASLSGDDRAALEAELMAAEQTYNDAVAKADGIVKSANEKINLLTDELEKAEALLQETEADLFDHNIEAIVQGKADEIDAEVNAKKDSLFADFEAKYKDDINGTIDRLSATKKSIVTTIDQTTAEINAKKEELQSKFDEKYGDDIDYIKNGFNETFGDDVDYVKSYIKNALDSAKNQILEEINDLPLPEFPF